MAENKTKPTDASVAAFLDAVEGEQRRADCDVLMAMMGRVTGEPAKLWGPSIIGFGTYHYRYDSGREGDMPVAAFSPRKGEFSVYLTPDSPGQTELLSRLGKHRMGKSCLYIRKLADVDLAVLEQLVVGSMRDLDGRRC